MPSKHMSSEPVGVIGAGSFGTAVANLLASNADVLLYVHRGGAKQQGPSPVQVRGRALLAPNITTTHYLAEVAERCSVLFPIVPSGVFRSMLQQLAPWLKPHHVLIHGTKGLHVFWPPRHVGTRLPRLTREHVKTMSELIREESVVHQVGCLAGPNLSRELAQGQPAGTVVASPSEEVNKIGKQLLRSERFQVYNSTDLLGVELCGVLKNIIAIGAGCLSGLGYGNNTKSLLISRGLVEMVYIGRAMGASVKPFLGLSGVGDLVTSCSNNMSRNHTLGYHLAQGTALDQLTQKEVTVEGIHTVKTVRSLVDHYQIQAPITETLYRILFEDLPVPEAIRHFIEHQSYDVDIDFI